MILFIGFCGHYGESNLLQPILIATGSLFEDSNFLSIHNEITIQNKTYLFYKGTFPLSHFFNATSNIDNKLKIENDIVDQQNKSEVGMNGTNKNISSLNSDDLLIPITSNTDARDENDFWAMNASDWIAIFLGIIALVVSLPSLIGLIISHLFRPKIDIIIVRPPSPNHENIPQYEHNQEVKWSDLHIVNIRNHTNRTFRIQIKVSTKDFLQLKPDMHHYFPRSGMGKGYPSNEGFWIMSELIDFPGGVVSAYTFPLISKPKENTIRITVYPRINLSEFGLPSFYGEISLRPVEATFRIVIV